jgi:hypothetical protein
LDPHIGVIARLLEAVRTVPIWLFFAIAASLSVLVVFPGFQAALSFSGPFTQFAMIAAWIFFADRVVEPITSAVVTYIQFRRDARYSQPVPMLLVHLAAARWNSGHSIVAALHGEKPICRTSAFDASACG